MTKTKICFKQTGCKNPNPQPLENFYPHPQMGDGYLNKCIECTKLDTRLREERKMRDPAWREKERLRHIKKAERQVARLRGTEVFKVWREKANENWNAKFPEGRRAHGIVAGAIKSGKLIRATRCERCGAGGKIEGHHADYSKPLEVEWLCIRCHHIVTFDEKRLAKQFTLFS